MREIQSKYLQIKFPSQDLLSKRKTKSKSQNSRKPTKYALERAEDRYH